MKQTLFALFALLVCGLAHADSERVIINAHTDECTLFRALNGAAVPERCKSDSKSVIKEKPQIAELKITFHSNSARLTADSTVVLANVAKAMSSPDSTRQSYRVDGHTDAAGDPRRNFKLSNRRAESVLDYLLGEGVPPERLSSQGFGATHLADPVHPTSYLNRRVEVVNLSQ